MDEFKQQLPANNKRGAKGVFVKILLVIILISAGIIWWKYSYTYSDGYRSGLLQKLSHKGNIVKTYEGELVMSSVSTGTNVTLASEKFYFSVADATVAKAMMNYEGKKVRVHYRQKNGKLFWRGDSEYIVDEVTAEEAGMP